MIGMMLKMLLIITSIHIRTMVLQYNYYKAVVIAIKSNQIINTTWFHSIAYSVVQYVTTCSLSTIS